MTEVRRTSHLERTLFKFLRSEQPQNQANKKRSEKIVNPLHNHKITTAELVFYFFVGRGEVGRRGEGGVDERCKDKGSFTASEISPFLCR